MNPLLRKGRKAVERIAKEVGELTRDDLEKLRLKRTTPAAQKFRDPHHRVARLLASGLRQFEVAEATGYSIGRVYMLAADPAFQELIAYYREKVNQAFVESQDAYHSLLTSNMMKSERMLAEKLDAADEAGELLPTRELISISRDAADRVGYGKKQTNLNVNVDFAAQLEKAIKRSGKVIDLKPVEAGPKSPAPPSPAPNPPGAATREGLAPEAPPAFRRRA